MTRLIDLICRHHQDLIINTRLWPTTWRDGAGCRDCADRDPVRLLPHLDGDEQLAVHEAGHAIGHLLGSGTTIMFATLHSADIDGAGPAGLGYIGDYDPRALMAGGAAVAHWAGPGDANTVDMVFGARHDAIAGYRDGLSADNMMAAFGQAEIMVAERWPAVERVADMLLARGRLSGAEIADLAGLAGCIR